MNINVTLSHCRQMPVFVFGANPNLRQCEIYTPNKCRSVDIQQKMADLKQTIFLKKPKNSYYNEIIVIIMRHA